MESSSRRNVHRPPRQQTLVWQISGAESEVRIVLAHIARRGDRGPTPEQEAKLKVLREDLKGLRAELARYRAEQESADT